MKAKFESKINGDLEQFLEQSNSLAKGISDSLSNNESKHSEEINSLMLSKHKLNEKRM